MKELLKCQEMMTLQQEIYQIIHIKVNCDIANEITYNT